MLFRKKKSIWTRLTKRGMSAENDPRDEHTLLHNHDPYAYPDNEEYRTEVQNDTQWISEEAEEGQLTVDVYHTPDEIVIKTMVAGVRPEDLEINIARDMVTIKGRRSEEINASEEDYFLKELYWGSFSRTIMLPEEIDPDEAEAVEKHGLLTIHLPKLDKKKVQRIKVKSQ